MRIFKIFFLFLVFAQLTAGQTRNFKFRHYSINEGLIQNSCSSILLDSKGFIWFGTYGGLSKFDGYKFTNYMLHSNDSTSLVNNIIQTMFEDSKGNIWIGTRAGLSIFNRDRNKFTTIYPLKNKTELSITSIAEDNNGMIFLGTYGNGLIVYNPAPKEFTSYRYNSKNKTSICSDFVSDIIFDMNNNAWVSTYHGLNYFEKQTKKFTQFKRTNYKAADWHKDAISSIEFDDKGNIWVGSNYSVAKFNTLQNKFEDYIILNSGNKGNSSGNVRTLQFVDNNYLWAGTDNGIIVLNINDRTTFKIKHEIYNSESLSSNEIETIFLDKTGNLWIGTRASGVDKLKFIKERFAHYVNNSKELNSLSNNEIYGMAEDRNGDIWLATLQGLNKFFPKTKKFQSFIKRDYPGITNDRMWAVYTKKIKNDLVWVGTDAGLFVISSSTNKIVNPFNKPLLDSVKSDRIMAICIDNLNNLWLGAENGLIKINLTTESIKRFKHNPANPKSISNTFVYRFFLDSRENLWIGTTNGLNLLKPNSEEFSVFLNERNNPSSISNNEANEIIEDKDGSFWIGTSDGLNKYYPEKGTFEHIKLSNIPSETIYSIQQDNKGCLWIGTGKGLVKFDPQKKESVHYDIEDGIQSNEFNFPSLISAAGEYYFAGINGFSVFKPDDVYTNNFIPPVYITGFYVLNQPIGVGELYKGTLVLKEALENVKEINLSYRDNILSFEFAALDYQSPNKNYYMYRMENYEASWNEAAGRRFVTYSLEPGTYSFTVKGSNNDKVWNNQGYTLTINILPPWWKTLWFKLIITLLVCGILFSIFYIRTRYFKRQKADLERLVIERTAELAKQQGIVEEQAERIQLTNLELEQLNSELEQRVVERTAELEKAKEKAEKADEIKSEFLAQMSHEIRSPINVVLSFSNLIKSEVEDKIDDDLKEGFKSISNAGKRIIRTVDLLLNMSEIQTQTYDYVPVEYDLLNDILYTLLPEYQITAKEKKLNFVIENKTEKAKIIGDLYTLEQIFANLIDNAIKYTNRGAIVIRIFTDEIGLIICEIQDSGIGISSEFMEKLFLPFTQEEQGYTRKYEGNGLGLALVKKYCELNGIDISVKSKKGEGTTFALKFSRTIQITSNNEI